MNDDFAKNECSLSVGDTQHLLVVKILFPLWCLGNIKNLGMRPCIRVQRITWWNLYYLIFLPCG